MINTTRRLAGVTAAAAILLVAVWYLALSRPQSHHLTSTHHAYSQAQQTADQLQSQVNSLEALERQVPADQAKLKALDAAVPPTADLKDVLTQLHVLAVASGVELTAVGPGAGTGSTTSGTGGATAAAGPVPVTLSMTLSGSYPSVTHFMTGLAQMARTVTVDSVGLTPSNPTITASLTARIFYAPR